MACVFTVKGTNKQNISKVFGITHNAASQNTILRYSNFGKKAVQRDMENMLNMFNDVLYLITFFY